MNKNFAVQRKFDENYFENLLSMIEDPVLSQIYAGRNVRGAHELDYKLKNLLHFDSFKNIEAVVARIFQSIVEGEFICVFGDFDTDGACSTALMCTALENYGARVGFYIPDRVQDGHGLQISGVDQVVERYPDVRLIITVDNGISARDAVEYADSLGISCLITDHHPEDCRDCIPDCLIVDPAQPDCKFPSKSICGAGVAFYVVLALRDYIRRNADRFQMKFRDFESFKVESLLDLVALGTVADVVSLDYNNRILVSSGLNRIRSNKSRYGIQALFHVSGRDIKQASVGDLSFYLSPRLNACGRLFSMEIGVHCLMAKSRGEALEVARKMEAFNQKRKTIQSRMLEKATSITLQLLEEPDRFRYSLTMTQKDWHVGLLGVIAAKIRDRFGRNVFIFAPKDDQFLIGSGRGLASVDIKLAVENIAGENPDALLRFGGHSSACGLVIRRSFFDHFREKLEFQISEQRPSAASFQYDVCLDASQISLSLAKNIDQNVWGKGFERPDFLSTFDIIKQKRFSSRYTKLILKSGSRHFDAVSYDDEPFPERIQAIYQLNYDASTDSIEILIRDWRKDERVDLSEILVC